MAGAAHGVLLTCRPPAACARQRKGMRQGTCKGSPCGAQAGPFARAPFAQVHGTTARCRERVGELVDNRNPIILAIRGVRATACPGASMPGPASRTRIGGESICMDGASNGAVRVDLDPGRVCSDTIKPGWSSPAGKSRFRRLERLRGRPGARTALHRHLHRYPGPRSRAWLWSRDGTHAPRCLQADQGQPSRLVREMTRGTGEGFSFRTTPHFSRASSARVGKISCYRAIASIVLSCNASYT